MISKTLIIGAIAAPFLLAGCMSADGTTSSSSKAQRGQIVSITPEVRAEVRRQGLDPDEEVCETITPSGSTIPKKICATRGAWEAQRQAGRQGLEGGQRGGLQTADPAAGGG